ncbi:MAG: hypothetical protein P8Z77_16330 [Candidatus Thiodiazotropha sp.]
MIRFEQAEVHQRLAHRQLLCEPVESAHLAALEWVHKQQRGSLLWQVSLASDLLFDRDGLKALSDLIGAYSGAASHLKFKLRLSPETVRDYYSHSSALDSEGCVALPVIAHRIGSNSDTEETLSVTLKELSTPINFPQALCPPGNNVTPLALLLPYTCEHDLLFANQIALFSQLNRYAPRSFTAILRAVLDRRKVSLPRRIALSWRRISPEVEIHPTAVVEGSVIGRGCRIGAHCVVRYCVLGENVQLHDGAKAEFSVIGDRSWLMHDLVLYRSLVETDVFLIHGPYQFSYFKHRSSAFACIMMDYRPDAKPIGIGTEQGVRHYQGRFLGALLEEEAKVLGGTLTAPGITIPAERHICAQAEFITRAKDLQGHHGTQSNR